MKIPELLRRAAKCAEVHENYSLANDCKAAAAEMEQAEPVAWLRDDGVDSFEFASRDDPCGFAAYRHPAPVARATVSDQAEPAMWAYYLGNGQYTFDCDKPEWLVPLYRAPVAPAVPTLFINYPEDGIPDDAETAYREGYIAGWGASRPAVPEWTTIEDGMPKDKGRWYLFGGFTSGGEWSFDKLYYDLAGRVNGWITAALKTKGITHWLLPEPPEPDAFQSLVRDGIVATQGGKVITARELYKEPDDTDGGEMRRDAERLDFLEHKAYRSPTGISFDWAPSLDGERGGYRMMWRRTLCERRDTIRKAIDAAMKEEE